MSEEKSHIAIFESETRAPSASLKAKAMRAMVLSSIADSREKVP